MIALGTIAFGGDDLQVPWYGEPADSGVIQRHDVIENVRNARHFRFPDRSLPQSFQIPAINPRRGAEHHGCDVARPLAVGDPERDLPGYQLLARWCAVDPSKQTHDLLAAFDLGADGQELLEPGKHRTLALVA